MVEEQEILLGYICNKFAWRDCSSVLYFKDNTVDFFALDAVSNSVLYNDFRFKQRDL
jgi:hypothetical protein